MGKTVKSRTLMSIASFLFVVAFCLVANGSIPKIYESYKQKVIAQQAATKTTQVIKKETPTTVPQEEEPVVDEEPVAEDDFGSDDANVYDIDDSTTSDVPVEEPVEEPAEEEEEDVDFDFDFDDDSNKGTDDDNKKSGGFLEAIISFITGLVEKISKLDILAKFKEFLSKILAIFGITL